MTEDFYVECNVCGSRLKNWVGSTPCCGSIAYVIGEDGNKTQSMFLYANVDNRTIKPILVELNREVQDE